MNLEMMTYIHTVPSIFEQDIAGHNFTDGAVACYNMAYPRVQLLLNIADIYQYSDIFI